METTAPREYTNEELARIEPFGEGYRRLWTPELEKEISERIERHRKADCEVDGLPPGAEVSVRQETSDFLVGCNLFNFGQLGDEAQDAQYRKTWEPGGIFNAATIAFYWYNFEFEQGRPRYVSGPNDEPEHWRQFLAARVGKPVHLWTPECPPEWRRPAPDRLIAFCKRNGVSIHGHVILYPPWDPDWVKAVGLRDRNALQDYYDKRVYDIALYYRDTIPQWDVVNESYCRKSPPGNPNDDYDVHNGLWGRPVPTPWDYTFKAFKLAERLFPPSVKLCINDANNTGYFDFAASLLRRGAKIDVVGYQMHIFGDAAVTKTACGIPCTPNGMSWEPENQYRVFKSIDSATGKPIHLSEVTIPSPRTIYPREQADALQARMVRDNFRLWFSWPSIYRITYWNLVDGVGAEILDSGFYNRDMTKKAAYHAVDQLVNHEWKTNLECIADASGRVSFRGFKGDYVLTWTAPDGTKASRRVGVR